MCLRQLVRSFLIYSKSKKMSFIYCNGNNIEGPFHIIGDCHGCADELVELLEKLGYLLKEDGSIWAVRGSAAADFKLIFVGDYIDRGPKSAQVLHILLKAWQDGALFFPGINSTFSFQTHNLSNEYALGKYRFALGNDAEAKQHEDAQWQKIIAEAQKNNRDDSENILDAIKFEPVHINETSNSYKQRQLKRVPIMAVKGNHEFKLERVMCDRKVQAIFTDMASTMLSLRGAWQGLYRFAFGKDKNCFPFSYEELAAFLDALPHYITLEGGNLLVSHAGLCQDLQGKNNQKAAHFCLFGDANGKLDEKGFPIRHHWENSYTGKAQVVYGHTPVIKPLKCGNTWNIDTGCVFGGSLSALSYPQGEITSVKSRKIYCFKEGISNIGAGEKAII